jgi:Icc protein
MRLLHITDPHLHADPAARMRGVCTDETLRAVLAHVAASGQTPAAVLATGDLVQDETRAGYQRFRDLLTPLGVPVICIPGNHDAPELMAEVLASTPFQLGGQADFGGWRVIALSSWARHDDGGLLDKQELARLRTALADPGPAHFLVTLHHHPVPMGSHWLDGVPLRNAPDLLRIVDAEPRVRVLLWGHVHQASDRQRGHVRLLSTPSTCSQFRPGSDSFALDDQPPAYRWLTLTNGGTVESKVVWVPFP